MQSDLNDKMEFIKTWWTRGNNRPAVSFCHGVKKPVDDYGLPEANEFWKPGSETPDYEGLVEFWADFIKDIDYGDLIPFIPHNFGKRPAPMTVAMYLGGEVELREKTVWTHPVIDSWDKFEIECSPENPWWQKSLGLLEKSCELMQDKMLVSLPDFGDALTCFSLLRGAEKLLFDMLDDEETIIQARDKFVEAWKQYHNACWNIYRKYYPGDCNWLGWAPGKVYQVQCDTCTMISPELFKKLVVPELESLSGYLEYMTWHLDGKEELKHLDMLLDLPFIKAIQWVPGSNQPTASNWLDVLKKIQSRKKNLYVYSSSAEETKVLLKELSVPGLWIHEYF